VTKVHREAVRFAGEGYTIVLLGTPRHPEVVGLLGFAPNAIVVDEEADWERLWAVSEQLTGVVYAWPTS